MPDPDDYWSSDSDPYINPATGVLRNIPGFKTEAQLELFEEIVFQAHFLEATAYAESCTVYTLHDWDVIHGICFADVYGWSGQIRTVRISKGHTVFCYPDHILSEAERIFQELNAALANGTLTLEECARFYGDMNVLHPFREGNGRSQRILFAAILKRIGYQADYTGLDAQQLIAALIEFYHGNNRKLEELFSSIAERIT